MRLRIPRVPPATAGIVPVMGLSNKAWGPDPSACSEVQDGKRRRPSVEVVADAEQRLDRK